MSANQNVVFTEEENRLLSMFFELGNQIPGPRITKQGFCRSATMLQIEHCIAQYEEILSKRKFTTRTDDGAIEEVRITREMREKLESIKALLTLVQSR